MPVADLSIGAPGRPEVEAPPGDPFVEPDDVADEPVPEVDEAVVRGLLRSLGGGASFALGDADVPDHWRFTDRELDDLTPPLTRIINRRPKLRRAVLRGDEMTVAVVLAGYAGRNVAAARTAQEVRNGREREADRAAPGAPAGDHRAPGATGGNGSHGGGLHRPAG